MKEFWLVVLKIGFLSIFLSLLSNWAYSQTSFFAVNPSSANWNASGRWSLSQGGVALTCATCVEGTDFPGAGDDAYTEGKNVLIPSGFAAKVNNLYVDYTTPNGITAGLGSSRSVTINGELAAYDPVALGYAIPTVAVINTSSSSLSLVFTGANNVSVINPTAWSISAPLRQISFNPALSTTTLFVSTLAVANIGTLTVQNGTLEIDGSLQSAAGATTGTITVNTGATLFVNTGTISGDGTNTSTFPTLISNGTVRSAANSTAFINVATITLNANSTFNVGFNGANQNCAGCGGWWYQTTAPGLAADPASTINFTAAAAQSIFAQTYGNLTLSGAGSLTKSVTGAGSINIAGNLTFNNTGITFLAGATNQATFNGTGAQIISGGGTANFNGGLTVNKSAGTLTLSQNISVQNGLTITAGTIDLGSTTLTLTGNLANNGTFTATTSTTVIAGATSILGASITSFDNLTINGSGVLTAPTGNLNVAGNFINSGSFVANGGTLVFNGATAQTITGTTAVNNMTVSNTTGGVNNNGAITLNGILNLSGSGAFNANGTGAGTLTIASTGQSTGGMIGALTTPSNFSGNVTVQRFINGPGDWRYISMPITTGNVGILQSAFPVTGSFSNSSPNGVNGVVNSSAASVYYYDAPTQAWVAVGSGGTTGATPLSNLVGYSAYTYTSANTTINATGPIATGTVNIPLSTTSPGWNLIPNPYPSAVSWNLMTRTGLSNTITLRITNGTFATYVAGGSVCTGCGFNSNWRGEIPIGQSFWVNSTSATNLALTETVKTTTQPTFVREVAAQNLVRVTLHSPTQVDDAVVMFKPGATINFDTLYDGLKRKNGDYISNLGRNSYINISSYATSASADMAINSMPLISCSQSVKLKVEDVPVGSYTMVFTDLNTMNLGYSIQLIDHFLGTQTAVKDSTQYAFAVTSSLSSFGDSRFELVFTPPTISLSAPPVTVSNQCDPNSLPVSLNAQAGVNYKFSIAGTIVSDSISGIGQSATLTIDKSKLTSGSNTLDLVATTVGGCSTTKFLNALSYLYEAIPKLPKVLNDTICKSAKATLTANGAPSDGRYFWYDSLTGTIPIPGANGSTYQTDTLSTTTSYYVTAANTYGCQSARAQVTASVNLIPKPTVSKAGLVLTSSSSSGNQWLLNNTPVSGATGQQFQPNKSGIYSLMVTNKGCSNVSDTVQVVLSITGLEINNNEIWKAYPNPVKDQLHLDIATGFDDLKIFDSQGRVMDSFKSSATGASVSLQIDLSNYAKGLYLIRLITGNKNYTIKIIKE